MAWLGDFLTDVADTARAYGVDPLTFTIIYLASVPFFWGGGALVGKGTLNRFKPLAGSHGNDIALGLGVCAVAWMAPYAYVVVYGRALPWWFWLVFAFVLVLSGRSAWRRIAKARE